MQDPRSLDRVQAELGRLERLTATILTSAGEGIYGLDGDGHATFVNPAAAAMVGWSVEELLGEPMHANHHHSHPGGEPYERSDCPIYAAFKDGRVHSVDDEVFWRRDGSSFPVEYTSTPILENGRPVGAVVVFRDITERRRAEAEIEALTSRLEAENSYLREEAGEAAATGGLVGESSATESLRRAIATVAPSDASVLVTGETGTGKEVVARAIHRASARAERPLIKVNCASISRDLFESEFFGHTEGAFTGAVRGRLGRFELADGGTLFLDEVGELPLDMQTKLLRVLQEGEFERVGEDRTRRVDVRVIAATNRDLRSAIADGSFRQDLYYRLNVVPVDLAPLRDRAADVLPLARHFLADWARRTNRSAPRLTRAAARELGAYPWPGNVRELQNVIERALVLSRGAALEVDLPEADRDGAPVDREHSGPSGVMTEAELRRLELDNLRAALEAADGRVHGPDGAAELLGLRPTTLASRLKKLGLTPRRR